MPVLNATPVKAKERSTFSERNYSNYRYGVPVFGFCAGVAIGFVAGGIEMGFGGGGLLGLQQR